MHNGHWYHNGACHHCPHIGFYAGLMDGRKNHILSVEGAARPVQEPEIRAEAFATCWPTPSLEAHRKTREEGHRERTEIS